LQHARFCPQCLRQGSKDEQLVVDPGKIGSGGLKLHAVSGARIGVSLGGCKGFEVHAQAFELHPFNGRKSLPAFQMRHGVKHLDPDKMCIFHAFPGTVIFAAIILVLNRNVAKSEFYRVPECGPGGRHGPDVSSRHTRAGAERAANAPWC